MRQKATPPKSPFSVLGRQRAIRLILHANRVVELIELSEGGRRLRLATAAVAAALPARLALRIPLALAHVLVQGAGHREGHAAVLAVARLLADAAVRLHVARELAALGARVRAQLTLVRLLARVRAPVHRQVRAVLEHLAAVLAGVRALLALHLHRRRWSAVVGVVVVVVVA